MTKANHSKFKERYSGIDWEHEIGNVQCPSEMTKILHRITNELTDECFPWRD